MKEQLEHNPKRNTVQTITKKIEKSCPNSTGRHYKTRSSSRVSAECLICYNDIICQGKLDCCDHEFCFTCIHKWSKLGKVTCPACRKTFKQIESNQIRVDYNESKKSKTVPKIVKIKSHLINIRLFENPSFQRLTQIFNYDWIRVLYDHQP